MARNEHGDQEPAGGLNAPAGGSNAVRKAVIKLLTKSGKRKRDSQIFSVLYYDTHVRPHANYNKYLASVEDGTEPMSPLAYINSRTLIAWENALPEIHQHVMEYKKLADMSLEELVGMECDDGDGNDNNEENCKRHALTWSNRIAHSRDYVAAMVQGCALEAEVIPGGEGPSAPRGTSSQGKSVGLEDASKTDVIPGGEGPSEGSKTPSEALSGNAAVLTKENQATAMFKSAIRETLQMKRMDGHEKCVFYPSTCY